MSGPLTLKDVLREARLVNDRLIIAALCAGVLFLIVMARLVLLQIVEHEHFNALSVKNRVDIIPVAPQRGLIFDRHGVLLAENIPTFSLEMTPENVVDMDATLAALAQLFGIPNDKILEIKKQIRHQRRFRQIIIRQRLTPQEVALFSVNRYRFPGVDVVGRLIRHYPFGDLFAHTVGYVGRINERDLKRIDEKNYQGTRQIGKTGIERQYETLLHGIVGYKRVETNAQGRIVRELKREPAISGQDLYLNIDINLQRVAAQALGEFNGSVVAIDPRNGEILAMVSKPEFDPNAFVLGISRKAYAALRDSPDMPLFDRSLRGRYPPGSTLKPFVALAGLEEGVITEHTHTFCPGWFSLPGQKHRYRCWKKQGHGSVDLKRAIAQSCDVYFYDLANALGIDRWHDFLELFGFGRKTGVDLPGESKGLLPSRRWKREVRHQAWYPGETIIAGIGQGFNQMTPIQLAHATAILAMRGVDIPPRLARAVRKKGEKEIELLAAPKAKTLPIHNSAHWDAVIQAMVEVMHGKRGTARASAKGLPFKMAGKTGTAQVFGIKQDEKYDAKTLEKKLHDHALFIAFAPADHPQIAIAVIAENGGGGSHTAAPIARKLIDQYFGLTQP